MKKRIMIMIICTILLSLGLLGCEDKKENIIASKDKVDDVTLTLWTIAIESDAFHTPFVKAIEDYEAAHPGVRIEMATYENQAYKTKIKSAVASNELPDIFFTWGGGFSKTFVESGKVLSLDDYYADYKDELSEVAVSYATYEGSLYGTTYVAPVSMLFYNREILDTHGLQPPQTWEDLIIVCETLKADDIVPIAVSAKDTWVLAMMHDALALKTAGHDKVQSALTKDGQSYNDPDFLDAAQKLKELIDMGAFSDRATELSNDEAQATFTRGEAAMFIMGSWTGGVILSDVEDVEKFDVVPVPTLGKNAAATDFMGGAVDTLMVNARTTHPEIAADAAFEIARSVSKYAFLEGIGMAAWTTEYDTSSVNKLSTKIVEYTKGATSFTLWFDTLMEPEDASVYLTLLQEFYVGNLDPESFVEGMDAQLSQ